MKYRNVYFFLYLENIDDKRFTQNRVKWLLFFIFQFLGEFQNRVRISCIHFSKNFSTSFHPCLWNIVFTKFSISTVNVPRRGFESMLIKYKKQKLIRCFVSAQKQILECTSSVKFCTGKVVPDPNPKTLLNVNPKPTRTRNI